MGDFKATRRDTLITAFGTVVAGAVALPQGSANARSGMSPSLCEHEPVGRQMPDGRRRSDQGNGTFLNPVLAGDNPDPSVLRDGDRYYKVSSSFEYYPGLVVWESPDLVNWTVIGPALRTPIGSIFAPDLVKHDGRFFIYFPAINLSNRNEQKAGTPTHSPLSTYVVHAETMSGPWSEPVDLNMREGIDPGHAVGDDGRRYLFFSGGKRVPLANDGLSRAGPGEKVYGGWQYPADWIVEGFELEGPKVLKKDGWFYLFTAEGGTGGPPTGHMVVVARSRSIDGPWENCPHNPIVRTQSKDEPWWSRGHATPVQDKSGNWWLVYHGYENGFRTLGRQMLMEPLAWDNNGWPVAKGGALDRPLAVPAATTRGHDHGIAFSGPFDDAAIGRRFQFFRPGLDYNKRVSFKDGALELASEGSSPANSSPLVMNVGDRAYEVSLEVEIGEGAVGGLLLYYDQRYFCGLGASAKSLRDYKHGSEPPFALPSASPGRRFRMRLVNDENIASFYYALSGGDWVLHRSYEVSGYNHNVADGFLSLRPAIFSAGQGSVTYGALEYRGRRS